jgi:hypothetical protein
VYGDAHVLLVTSINNYSLTIWREADGNHGAHWQKPRKVADCEAWLPESHKTLAPYLKARAAEWPVDSAVDAGRVELLEKLARAEAEVAEVRLALTNK